MKRTKYSFLIRSWRLFAALPADAQKFLTTTHLDWLDGPASGPVWRVHEGKLEEVGA